MSGMISSSTKEALPAFPARSGCPLDPGSDTAAPIAARGPVTRVRMVGDTTAWLVTRYEDFRKVLSDPRMSSDRRLPGFPMLAPIQLAVEDRRLPMLWMDPPRHTQARRSVLGEFTGRRVEEFRPRLQAITDQHITAMLDAGSPADLVHALTLPIPSLVVCELLGVPYTDHRFFQERTTRIASRETAMPDRAKAAAELRAFIGELIAAKEREPTEDLLGRQIVKLRAEGTYDRDALVPLAFLLLIAGHETTANMLALGTLALLEHPDQLAAIKADPARTPRAVEELLRYFSVVETATSRVALADIEIGGVLVREGEGVVALSRAANRDPSVFERPDELDISRGTTRHLAFGFGPHQCIGQALARMEMQIFFDTLFARVPTLRLAVPADRLPYKDDAEVYGVYELPVTW